MTPESVIRDLANFCVDVWEAGDGCPRSWIKVMDLFKKDVLPVYQKYRKGDIHDEKKQKEKETTYLSTKA